ncbi:glutathione-regulated potassium-efflux system protein KefB [Jannaschia seosinensis]|uniref:Glutathione-regulated potassium-efflux system protein KefB n=1 Tax=Jannaschia seosinensis TaxID=313367 RepID=A0A0M7B8A6_9RHOB|nr:cation:proton antiporter [Jannaschia seosinensis]CUH12037.1 glutathione-regulated potassium-efflux system protein KefB [Jannaschia seosinensis]
MTEPIQSTSILILLIGILVAAAVVVRAGLSRTYVPSLVGYMALGFLLRLADDRWNFLSEQGDFAFEILAELGIIVLLFRVGLESDLQGLRRQLGSASVIWLGNVALSATAGYFVMTYLLGFDQIPSLIAAVAMTATSIGVSIGMWRQHDALRTRKGQLLTDVAKMDDLSGVALMALLFAVIPVLRETAGSGDGPGSGGLATQLLTSGGIFFLKFFLFAGFCVAFARYGEERLTKTFQRLAPGPELMVLVAGIAILIAGVAAWLEFSAAIGALFAGLAFSRDPEAVHIDADFRGLYDLFSPFFFIGIGLALETGALTSALGTGAVLAAVAIVVKVLGAGLPSLLSSGMAGATLIGVSLVPRAEITMIIMERGRQIGEWAVPANLYAAFVLVSAVTCLVAPISLEMLFRRWPAEIKGGEDGQG